MFSLILLLGIKCGLSTGEVITMVSISAAKNFWLVGLVDKCVMDFLSNIIDLPEN